MVGCRVVCVLVLPVTNVLGIPEGFVGRRYLVFCCLMLLLWLFDLRFAFVLVRFAIEGLRLLP